jgi:hypothetical protein
MLHPYDIYYGNLVHLLVVWYIFYRFGMLWQEKYGNPVLGQSSALLPSFPSKIFRNVEILFGQILSQLKKSEQGVNLIKLHFGRKIFGQILSQILDIVRT